jgi:hypothetical protein
MVFQDLLSILSEAKEVTANAGSSASSAWSGSLTVNSPNEQYKTLSNFSVPHRIVANLTYNIKNTSIGVYYSGANQGRFSYYYSNDVNGDGVANDLMYIPKSDAEIKFVNITSGSTVLFTAQQQLDAFNKFIRDNDLEKYRGKVVPRNGFLLPWNNRIDLRISQTLFNNMASKGDKVQISLDFINFGNLLNSKWGIQDYNVSSYGAAILSKSGSAATNPSFTMLRDGSNLVSYY